MDFKSAIVDEAGRKFAVVIVKEHVLSNPDLEALRQRFRSYFNKNLEVVFMVDQDGKPIFNGDTEIVALLENKDTVEVNDLPWTLRHT